MPLYRHRKSGCVFNVDRFGRAIRGNTVNHNTCACFFDPLPMQRVGRNLVRAKNAVENTAVRKLHSVTQREFFFQRAIRWHPVVAAPREVANFWIQRTTHGNVHLLEPAADAKNWQTPFDTGADQRKRDTITTAIKIAIGGCRLFAVFIRVYVWTCASKDKASASFHKVFDLDMLGGCWDQQRQSIANITNGFDVDRATAVDFISIIDHVTVGQNTDNWPCHNIP